MFKMGDKFEIQSETVDNGFSCTLDVPEWMKKDSDMKDWTVPLTPVPKARTSKRAGTTITVSKMKKSVADLLSSRQFEGNLSKAVGRVYAFLVEKYVRISINGVDVKAFSVPVGQPEKGKASYEKFRHDGVKVRILATLSSPGKDRPKKENSGWYVACNGRLILVADTSELTGWGVKPTPIWVPKFTSFIGFVFFESTDALALPWTTTKRGVNRESSVYRKAISRMAVLARPILSFCNRKYGPDADREPVERDIARQMKPTTIAKLVKKASTAFEVRTPREDGKKKTVRVQYDAEVSEIERIRKHLRRSRMGASTIGKHTFDYFLRQEGLK